MNLIAQNLLRFCRRSALLVLLFNLAAASEAHAGNNVWTGNGPAGGIFWAFAFDTADPNIVYAGGYNTGVYKSADGGRTWTATGLPSCQVTLLVMDPSNGGILYAANAWGGGLYRSTDKGQSWTNIGAGLGSKDVRGFVYDPRRSDTLYAAVLNSGVYKTTDGGKNWTLNTAGFGEASFYSFSSLAIDWRNPDTLYAGVAGTPCLYKSTNGGVAWTASDSGLYLTPYALAVDPSNSNNVYLAAYGSKCFYKSLNGGGTWTESTSGIPSRADGHYCDWLAIDPNNPATLYLGSMNSGLFKSTNRGDSWAAANSGIFNPDVRVIAVHPSNPSIVFAGTWGSGVFRTGNAAGNWTQQGLVGTQIKTLAVDPVNPAVLYASTMGGGVYKSSDRGQAWTYAGLSGINMRGVAVDARSPTTVWALAPGYDNGPGVMKSTDSGATWRQGFAGFPETSFYALAVDPTASGTVYVGTSSSGGGIYKTVNGGTSWTAAAAGLPKATVLAVEVDRVNPQTLYSIVGNSVYKSTNGGANWTESAGGLPSKKTQALAVNPKNAAILFAGTNGSGLYKSINGGNTWNAVVLPAGFTSAGIYSVVFDPLNDNIVYAATSGGVLRSSEGGAGWIPMNSGLPERAAFCIAVDPKDPKTVHAGMSSTGAFTYTAGDAALTLYFPRLVSAGATGASTDDSEYTGIGVANLGNTDASLTFTAYDVQGRIISGPGITNPATVPLAQGAQLPIVDSQLWGAGLPQARPNGWFTLDSSSAKVVGFFLVYNAGLSVLDGADVSSGRIDTFVFPEVDPNGITQLHIANPNAAAASVTLDLKKADGGTRASVVRTVAANGSISERLSSLFSGAAPEAADYVVVRASAGLVPFEYVGRLPAQVQGLRGQSSLAGGTTLYSPQYVAGGSDWATFLSIVNLEQTAGTVTARLIGDNGEQLGIERSLSIPAGGKIRIDDQQFFAGGAPAQGYVEIRSSGPRLAGSVVFGDPGGSSFAAALPLVAALQSDVVFSQVASNSTWFTGLALLNPGNSDAVATIEVHDRAGNILCSKAQTIKAFARKSQLLTQYFPELSGVEISSGYIRVVSDRPIASFALFGTNHLSVLSAVPPQVVP